MIQVSIVIVNYNVRHFLRQALQSVMKSCESITHEIWVVDNNSVDGSIEMIKNEFPAVKLIANAENVGFSRANNQAMRQCKGEYILMLNPDTLLGEDTISACLNFMNNHQDAGALGVRMIDGSGSFLPESKRGMLTPWVAFCKSTGLYRLFPKSKLFNSYYLGHLNETDTNEVDVLSGAFMFMCKKILKQIDYLDEDFFMYGEDIDLSFRIQKAGYKNYYLPQSTIIHYKGESTKRGSINYVRMFYNAMIIFANKHQRKGLGNWYVEALKLAIYLRGALSFILSWLRKLAMPLIDLVFLVALLFVVKYFWSVYRYQNSDYFNSWSVPYVIGLYALIWLVCLQFSGAYKRLDNYKEVFNGMLIGAITNAAIYGFLDLEFRFSRAVLLISAIFGLILLPIWRIISIVLKSRSLQFSLTDPINVMIVGNPERKTQIQKLLQCTALEKNLVGVVSTIKETDDEVIGHVDHLKELAEMFKVHEIIFCASDMSSESIMKWMTELGARIHFKIMPKSSDFIIGSHNKTGVGELYTLNYEILLANATVKKKKRIFDVVISILFIIFGPIIYFFSYSKLKSIYKKSFHVIQNKSTWVGYAGNINDQEHLPLLPPGILNCLDEYAMRTNDSEIIKRINLNYARSYQWPTDLKIVWKSRKKLSL